MSYILRKRADASNFAKKKGSPSKATNNDMKANEFEAYAPLHLL